MRTHLLIPDTQVKPGVPLDHLDWIGRYIVDRQPDVIVHIGDHYDLPSLSSYDRGKRSFEGRRYRKDVEAGHRALERLEAPLDEYNRERRHRHEKQYRPEKHYCLGNHEARADRMAEENSELDGLIGSFEFMDFWDGRGWATHEFLKVIDVDGVWYTHFVANPMTGRPLGGMIETRLKNVGNSFTMGHQQTLQHGIRYVGKRQQHGLVAGACLTPDHKVLTADLRYVCLGSLVPGDKLVSFDEMVEDSEGRSRRYKTGTVKKIKREVRECFDVTLESGKVFTCTGDHLWMTRSFGPNIGDQSTYQWRSTSTLRAGTVVPKLLDEWEAGQTADDGYVGGMLDGEGCLYTRTSSGHVTAQLSFSQRRNEALSRFERVCDGHGFGFNRQDNGGSNGDVVTLRYSGGLRSIARALGIFRPDRLLAKFKPKHLGRLACTKGQHDKVRSIEPVGKREIVMIDIDAKTMVVEGYGHHNCYLHDEDYKGPAGDSMISGNYHWRGIVIKHEVHNGQYDPMFVSLNYLCRRYTGADSLDEWMRETYGEAA